MTMIQVRQDHIHYHLAQAQNHHNNQDQVLHSFN